MRVCAGIVLYHPEIDRLLKNIQAVISQAELLVLLNNSEESFEEIKKAVSNCKELTATDNNGKPLRDRIKWINNDKNLGIAKALNQMLTVADNLGFKWILTLDQDSICCEGYVDTLFEFVRNYDNVPMISPRIIERGIFWEGNALHRKKKRKSDNRDTVEDVLFCITSGTLTNIDAVKSVGGWNERLFVDDVDREICIRLKYRGYRFLRVNTVELDHEFGSQLVNRKILFKTYTYRNYSPVHVYYQNRNIVYMIRRYGADYKKHPFWQLIRPHFVFFVKFLFEPHRFARLKAFYKGYFTGLFMKL